jgi:integrase/recombinase XerD
MNKSFNHGIYADLIKQYIAYKRSLGFKMEDTEERLRRFDRMTVIRGETSIGISKELFAEWNIPFPEESNVNRYTRISILRQFSSYLQMIGHNSYIPKLPKYKSIFTPHIFTKAEIESIFQASDKLFLKRKYMYSQMCAMPSLLRMLYSTGLRVGEALNLTHRDVNLDKGYLVLKDCKNGRDRVVPISKSLVEVCKDYYAFKLKQFIDTGPSTYFFTALNGSRCQTFTVYEHFRTVLYKAGISHKGRGIGPRLHDLRHTFCVNVLLKMSEAGLDLYYSMPILSTYIGHQSIEATNKYVRLTSEMYPSLLDKVNSIYKYVFPEIGIDDSDFN